MEPLTNLEVASLEAKRDDQLDEDFVNLGRSECRAESLAKRSAEIEELCNKADVEVPV